MTRSSPVQSNLFFLLSTATLGMGACIIVTDDGNDTEDDGADSTPKDLTTSDTGEDTDEPPSDGTGSTGNVTSMDGTTAGTGTPETTGEADTTTGAQSDACTDYANTYAECVGDPKAYDPALYGCLQYLDYGFGYSDDCGTAYEEFIVCLSALDCKAFLDPAACADEQTKISEACPKA